MAILYTGKKTRSKTHSKEEHNAPTPTHKRSERTCIYTRINKRGQQFSRQKKLTPDDGHIGRNI
jgi:hypothetical protein